MKTKLKSSALTALNLAAALFAFATLPAFAAGPYYWDNNTTTAGFGTAGGTWGTSAFWNTDSTGGSGGAFSTTTGTGDSVNFGTASAGLAAGTVALTGTSQGFLNMTFGSASGAIVVNAASTSLNIAGGATITVNNTSDTIGSGTKLIGSGGLTISGSGTLTLSGGNTYTGGTIINSGATLKLGNGTALGAASGAVTVNSGGCLNLGGVNLANANALTLNGTGVTSLGALTTSGGQPAQYIGLVTLGSASSIIAGSGDIVLNNTGTITGAGLGLTVGGAKNTYIFSILGTTTGTLTKQDAGTLTLTNVNTYSGNTTINNGKLVGVTGGSCASSAVTVQSSGASTAASLGVYYTGANAQWTCSSLTTSAGVSGGAAPNLAFGFSITPSAGTAPLNVSGNVSFDASTTITVDPANLVSGQSYPLLVASGTVPSTTPTVTIGRGLTGTVAWGGTGNKTLTLTVAGTSVEPLKWQPASATWSPGDANSNWKDAGGTAASYTEGVIGDQVLFDDTPGAATTVTLNTDAKPGSITFNNSTYSYTLSGNGGVIGSATLTKTGTGTVTINTPVSSYSGGTVIKNGTVILKNAANPNALGSGTITLGDASGGPVTLLGSWQAYANPINLAANAVGPISLGSSGEFLGENGSWKGAINLNGNNLNLTRPALVLTAVYQIQSAISGTGSLTISNASTGNSASGITFASGGPISISGNITNASSGASGATTTINVSVGSGVTNIVQNSASLPLTVSGALTVNPSTTLVNASGAGALFTLSGGATGTGGLTLNNNSSTADAITVMTGAINPTGGVTNSGTGSGEVLISSVLGANVTAVVQKSATSNLKLQGVNTYTGDTIVSAGSLILDTTCTMASPNFVLGGGGTLDVSTENTALALGNTQKLKVSATGTSSTATINMAASKGLTLNATAGKGVEFTAYNGGATAPLTLSGSGGSLALNSAPVTLSSASGLAAGPYTLISHGGSATVTGSPGTFSPGVGALATGATGALSVNGSGDLILTLSYTVTLTNNDASGTTSTISVANGSTYGTLPTPTRTGYTFNGWFTASSGGTQVTSGTTVSLAAPQTLYAQWTLSAVPPTKLVITAVPSGTTPAGNTFSVTVTAEDSGNTAQAVTSDTGISLALASGSGTLGGTTTGTIANGGSAVTISGLTYTKAEAITLTASRTSGMSLTTSVASSSFTIVPNMTTVPASSTVVASPASLAADGSSASTVTATLQDAYGNLLVGSNVTWTVTGSANNVSPASSGTTSGSGVVAFTVKSVKPETKTVTVSVGATVVTNSLTITFTTPSSGNKFVWDPSHNTTGSDAAGTWDTSTANWANGAADFAWPNNGSDNATFGSGAALGANYTVNLGTGITVGNLTNNTSGANQYTIGTVAQTLTLAGTTPTVSVAGTMQINSLVAGTAGLTKADSGTLILGTNNSFTGGLTIKNGTVATRNTSNKNLGGSGTGAVTLGDSAGGPASLLLSWQAWNNPITLGTGAVGPLTLGDTMEYTTGGNPLVSGGINLNGNNLNVYNAPGRANGSIVIQTAPITGSAGSSLTLSNANNNGSGSISIPANLDFTGAITNVGAGTNATLISGNIGSTVTAVVQNSATAGLTLSGSNTFSSGLYINAGTVTAGANTNALGGASGNGDGSVYLGDTSGSTDATLKFNYVLGGFANPITVRSGSSGTLTISATGYTPLAGPITQNNPFTVYPVGAQTILFNGQITGSSQITVTNDTGMGAVIFNADNHATWSGPLVVRNGTFRTQKPNSLSANNTVQLYPGTTFDTYFQSPTIAGLNDNGSGAGGMVTNVSYPGTTTLTVGGSGTYSFGGVIAGGGAYQMALTMSGSGTQTLGGANTYTGNTTINAGTLALSGSGSIANTPNISIAAGATFDVSVAGITLTGSSPQQTLAGGSPSATATINAPSQTVTLNSSALLSFQAAGGSSSTLGKISVAGSSANLTLNNNAVTVNVIGAALAAGTYRLLDCTGTLNGTANSTPAITGTALASGYTSTVSTTTGAGGHVDLIVNATPSFSGLTASPSITYGATSVSLSGTASSATGPTTVYAASGDTVTATIHGHAVSGTVSGSTGAFTITYNDASLATLGVGSSPYTITYAYAGNATVNLNAAANNTGTSLTVGKATPMATLAVNNSPATYNGSAQSATVVTNSSSVPGTVGNVKYNGLATAPVAAGTYPVTADFIPTDAADYNTLTGLPAGNFVINPAATTITLTGTTFTYNGSAQSPSISISGSTGIRSTNYTGTSYSGANAPTNVGSYTLTVSVLGDGNFFGATNSLPFTINQASISVGASSTNNPCGYHDAVAFLATLPADATGSVVFSSTNGPISTNNVSSGTVTSLSITNLPRGTNVITVAYLGDGNYLGSSTNLEQIVTNHPPIAGMMTVTRTAGLALIIKLSDIATNWSDVDGDTVELAIVTMQSTNGINLFPLNWSTNLDGGIVTTNGYAYIGYTNSPNVNDQISYGISDGFGGTNIGYVNIVIQGSVTGTNSITAYNFTSPASNTVTAYGIPFFSYILERSTNLSSPVWVDVQTNQAAPNGVINMVDLFLDLGGIKPSPAFYQLKWQP